MINCIYIACAISLFCCTGLLSTRDEHPFKVQDATSQEWIAGVRGGGRGITYTIRIQVTAASSIVFDSIWINNKQLKIDVKKGENLQAPTTLAVNDTLTLIASDATGRTPIDRMQEERAPAATPPVQPPIAHSGAGLLGYSVGGTKRYFVLTQIQQLPAIHGH